MLKQRDQIICKIDRIGQQVQELETQKQGDESIEIRVKQLYEEKEKLRLQFEAIDNCIKGFANGGVKRTVAPSTGVNR